MLTYPMYAALFDFCAPCPQRKILFFSRHPVDLIFFHNFTQNRDINIGINHQLILQLIHNIYLRALKNG